MTGFTVPIFIPDGNPSSVRILQRSTHTGRLLTCNRAFLSAALGRPELAQSGLYFLLGEDPDTTASRLYIGESDNVSLRIKSHDTAKDFWNQLAVYIAVDPPLNKAHVRFLEAKMLQLAQGTGLTLDNDTTPSLPPLGEANIADIADMESHIVDLLLLLQVAGIGLASPSEIPPQMVELNFFTPARFGRRIPSQRWISRQSRFDHSIRITAISIKLDFRSFGVVNY